MCPAKRSLTYATNPHMLPSNDLRDVDRCHACFAHQLIKRPTLLWSSAEPLEGDSDEVAIFRPLLAGTQLEKVPLRLAYDSAEHGWSARAFHQCVDGFGATLVVADTEGGAICGGYNPLGWISVGDDR